MIRLAICEDEKIIRDSLKETIKEYAQKNHLDFYIHTYANGKQLVESTGGYDLILMDIDLNEENGIEVGRKIRSYDKNVKIIYVTGYSEYMNSAFSVHAFGYILKPATANKIHEILDEAIRYMGDKKEVRCVKFLLKNGFKVFQTDEILYFEYYNRCVKVYCKNQIMYEIPGEKISNVAAKMNPHHFEVPHRSFVVNLFYVDYVKGYTIYLKTGEAIPLSQNYSRQFRQKMNEFLKMQL
ncbi:LytR/AlgR family response regulator transcription factor [Anaeromicropila populeti]|uniref:Stage 0 sporulation protein A homolog n=1 Tax=Anaeromicropila populeti TaxID=37658 RepID=A0A1I6KYQ1_9FIRM|nr:LytTR family DNA-binding domain-containing protein [Anaeromicropila populeti]SFR96352.1 two component transcriptional regulator, LytTR family [Anaeromicropila populeti]